MTKSKVFLVSMLAFIGGVGTGSFFDFFQKTILVILIAALILIAAFYRRGSSIFDPHLALVGLLIVAFIIGILRFETVESSTKILTNFNDSNVNINLLGYINDEPQRLLDKQRFILRVKEIKIPGHVFYQDEKVLVTADLYPEFDYGDSVSIAGRLVAPKEFSDFDYAAYLAKDSIFSLLYYPEIAKVSPEDLKQNEISGLEKFKVALFRNIFKIKKVFEDSISRSIAEPNASFLNGILLGSRGGIPQGLKDAFNKTGTSHILAISGYNITVVALYVSSLLMFFMRRQTAFWYTVLAIIVFAILTGASSSVIRAAIMGILVLLALRQGRFYNMINSIVFAGAVMTALNPRVLRFDAGFQLSFLATLGLVYLAPLISRRLQKIPDFLRLKESVITTVSAQIMVLPILLYSFKNFSAFSVFANALILPVVPLTMFFGFLSGVSGLIWSRLGELAGLAAWFLSGYELFVVKIFASL